MRDVTTPSGSRAHPLRVRHWERAVPPCRSTRPAAKRSHITVRATVTFHLRTKAFFCVWSACGRGQQWPGVPVEPSSSRNCPDQSGWLELIPGSRSLMALSKALTSAETCHPGSSAADVPCHMHWKIMMRATE
jgi:hypothetical protein